MNKGGFKDGLRHGVGLLQHIGETVIFSKFSICMHQLIFDDCL